MLAWLPIDDHYFATPLQTEKKINARFMTPFKAMKQSVDAIQRSSPVTRIQKWVHEIVLDIAEPLQDMTEQATSPERTLSTTEVFDIYTDTEVVLQHIYTAFLRISQVRMFYRDGHPQCVFKLTKGYSGITWHALKSISIDTSNLSGHKYPRSDNANLLALEDLGRGSTGKAWLMCTTSKDPAIYVLKFNDKRCV